MPLPDISDLTAYRGKLIAHIRRREAMKFRGDQEALDELAQTPDEFLIKKWLWTMCFIGGPGIFVGAPLLLCVLGIFTPAPIMDVLWVVTKILMALVLLTFSLMVFITLKTTRN